jgi:hypothetical protein
LAHAIRASQTDLKIKFHAVDPHTSLTRQKGFKVDDFYAARSRTIPPLPWSNIAPPFSIATGALAAGVPIIASGGAIPLALAACTAGGGIGAMLAKLVRKNLLTRDDADAIEHDINRGGIAVFVRVDNADEEQRAINIMRRNGTHNVHAHTITLRKELSDLSLANVQPDPWLADD